jgi:arginase
MFNLKEFQTIVAECRYGQPIDGVQYGGQYIADNMGLTVSDTIKDFTSIDGENNCAYKRLSNTIINNHPNSKTLVLGGDHSVGISSLDAMIQLYGDDLRVLWIDAHADINDYNSSITGNIHGMPLGFHFVGTSNVLPWNTNSRRLQPHQLYYFGIRDLDTFESNLITMYNIKHTNNINDDIVNYITTAPKLMISFDVDSLDPEYVDSTGTRATGGIKPSDIYSILNTAKNLVHLDITEFNPFIGDKENSINNIKKCFTIS